MEGIMKNYLQVLVYLMLILFVSCASGGNVKKGKTKKKSGFEMPANIVFDKVEGRKLLIYLPDGYEKSDTRYPVVYMHDGQNLFMKETASGGEWGVDELMTRLIKENKVEKMIIVGIYNTTKRAEEYVPYKDSYITNNMNVQTPGAKFFSDFVVNSIIPYIDDKYKTIADRENRAVMGSSFGGILSFWMGYNYSDTFSMVGALSPSFWVGNGYALIDVKDQPKRDIKIWLDRGTFEWIPHVRDMAAILMEKGYEYGKDLFYHELYRGVHTNDVFGKNVENALIVFKGKKGNPSMVDLDVKIESVPNFDRTGLILNPVVTTDNGVKYSLLKQASYKVVSPKELTIMDDGYFDFLSKDAKVEVTYGKLKKIVDLNYKDIHKMEVKSLFRICSGKKDGNTFKIDIKKSSVKSYTTNENIVVYLEKQEKLGVFKITNSNSEFITVDYSL